MLSFKYIFWVGGIFSPKLLLVDEKIDKKWFSRKRQFSFRQNIGENRRKSLSLDCETSKYD
jgi:hypothetical protein